MKKLFLIIALLTQLSFAQSNILLLMGDEGYTPVNFEVEIYTDTLTTAINDEQIERIDNFVTMLKDSLGVDSLSEKFDVMYLLANETSEIALRNLIKTTHRATQSATPTTFTAFEGFTGDGLSSYLNTNYNANTQGVRFTLNSGSIGTYVRTNADGGCVIGTFETYVTNIIPRLSNVFYGMINNNGASENVANTDSRGMFVTTRTKSNAVAMYKNGVSVKTTTTASGGVPNRIIFILARNKDTIDQYSAHQVSFAFAGIAFDATENRKIKNCIEWYMDDLGKGVIP